jgi:DNA-binding CsgD family transcriptional regulator
VTLTPRELDVMVALAITGQTYAEVGAILGIKEQTVKNHALAARHKYGVRSNAAFFVKIGWLVAPYQPVWYELPGTY